jgi:hypothetical protein
MPHGPSLSPEGTALRPVLEAQVEGSRNRPLHAETKSKEARAMPAPSAHRRPALRNIVLSAVVLALVAAIFLLQGRDGSDLPGGPDDAEEGAILGGAIQLVVPPSAIRPASSSDADSASADTSEGPEEQAPADEGTGSDGVTADQPDDSPSPGNLDKDGDDPTDLIEDLVDKLLGGSRGR